MAKRTDYFATNSYWVAGRVRQAYQREAQVIYPPVDTYRYNANLPREGYYVYVGRLVAQKRLELVIKAFNQLGFPLLIIGQGPEENRLRRIAGANVHFLGWRSNKSIAN